MQATLDTALEEMRVSREDTATEEAELNERLRTHMAIDKELKGTLGGFAQKFEHVQEELSATNRQYSERSDALVAATRALKEAEGCAFYRPSSYASVSRV
jgi:chromosome segregation ATPase